MLLTTSMLAFTLKMKINTYINSLYADTARCLYYCLRNMPTQLDVGHIINMSVKYDKITQMITCTSTGGPASEVSWFKDN